MPRPLLMPLSGGYRRVPVAQIGADVYCDTKIIARALAQHAGDDTLYAPGFAATRVADAADTELFRIMAALSFRLEAIGGLFQGGGGVRADAQELAVRRTTAETGVVVTHFPRTGFALES